MMGFPVISGQLTGYNEGKGTGDSKTCPNPRKLLATRNVNLPVPLALFRPSDLSSHVCVKSDAKATCSVLRIISMSRERYHCVTSKFLRKI